VSFRFEVTPALVGKRLDAAVAEMEKELSRTQIRRLIGAGWVRVSGAQAKPSHRLRLGERVEGEVPPPEPCELAPEAIPLDIVYEDSSLIVVDKPAGLVVHPAAGHRHGTLVHALLHHCKDLEGVGDELRPGIVHRLDKDTSGLLVAAKTHAAHRSLVAQFQAHTVDREYLALVRGAPRQESGSIDAAIGRHPSDRKRYTADGRLTRRSRVARRAVTHWRVERRLGELTLLRIRLETGRTHQIRVHLASIGLPVAGDPVYGGGRRAAAALGLRRQALHAARLGFDHPTSGQRLVFESDLPEDLARVVRGCAP
jgi:23S rRNA pseudouridine1911/1915/1917 synthase